MIFQYTWEAILEGRKTRTSRLEQRGDIWLAGDNGIVEVYNAAGNLRWRCDAIVGVQPGRGKPTIMVASLKTAEGVVWKVATSESGLMIWAFAKPLKIRITRIFRQDVESITEAEAQAEGFDSAKDFLKLWWSMHRRSAAFVLEFERWY